jgi:hypothetical protein
MFPQGRPGIALVFLRMSVALTVLLHAYAHSEGPPAWLLAALLLLAMLLVAGLLTPIVALLSIAVHCMLALDMTLLTAGPVAILILDALALALLGPGAYSLDALRFGRRVVELSSREGE